MQPHIFFEDDDIIVLDKPAGVTVNISDTTAGEETIQDWAMEYLGIPEISKEEKVLKVPKENGHTFDTSSSFDTFLERGGIVHRLDKETSGILLLAKNAESFAGLQQQFKERIVKKWYNALAHGKVTPESGEINIPVGRLPWNRRQFGIVAGGRESVTFYRVIDYYRLNDKRKEVLSFMELEPKTGRTHQIRVHLKYLNHPIFADFLYAGRKTANADRQILSRVFLHAAKISFIHPKTKEEVSFTSPLPKELAQILDQHCTKLL